MATNMQSSSWPVTHCVVFALSKTHCVPFALSKPTSLGVGPDTQLAPAQLSRGLWLSVCGGGGGGHLVHSQESVVFDKAECTQWESVEAFSLLSLQRCLSSVQCVVCGVNL